MRAPAQSVPGRLRLRFTQLKQQTGQLSRMAAALGAIGGVLEVETSPITGGFLIHFDAMIGNTPLFWDQVEAVLHAHQLMVNPRPLARQTGAAPTARPREGAPHQQDTSGPASGDPRARRGPDEKNAAHDAQRPRTAGADGCSDNISRTSRINHFSARASSAARAASLADVSLASASLASISVASVSLASADSANVVSSTSVANAATRILPQAQDQNAGSSACPAPPPGSWPSPAIRQPSGLRKPQPGERPFGASSLPRASPTFSASAAPWSGTRGSYPATATCTTGGGLVERIASALVDRLVERSAVALVAALL